MCAAPCHRRVQSKSESSADPTFWLAEDTLQRNRPSRSPKHLRRDSSRFAGYVGRVGALAVALGVGFAVANSTAVAHADSESEPSASPGSGNDSDSSSDRTGESSKQSDDDADDGDESGEEPADDAGLDDESVGGDVAAGDDPEDTGDSELADESGEEDPAVDEVEESVETDSGGHAEETATTPPAGGEPSSGATDDAVEEQSTDPTAEEGAEADAEASTPHDLEGLTEVDEAADGTVEETTTETVSDLVEVDVPATAESATPLASTATPEEASTEEVDVLTTVVSSVLSPFADPEAPAPTPWFDALLAWVRRQITHTFFNESPEWGPIEGRQVVTGQVLFDLNAFDPNGDPLTYKISQPEHGLVVRDPLSGEFIYTPTTVVTGEPLTDSFKVVISDSGEHLKGLVGLVQGVFHSLARAIGLAEPDEVALMVNVTVNPIVEVPPVIVATPAALGFNGEPIAVSPVLVITDLDSGSLSSASVTIGDPDSHDVLDYDTSLLPEDVSVEFAGGVLTFTGSASVSEYQQLLASVTLTAGGAGVKTVSFRVVDEQGNPNAVPAATVVTVLGVPGAVVAPVVVATPVAAGVTGSPVVVSPIVVITDLDSESLSSAMVTVDGPDDVLDFNSDLLPENVSAEFVGGVLTFTGSASVVEYQQLLASVTLAAGGAGLKTVSFRVVDEQGNASVVPAATVVTVVGVPGAVVAPVLVATPVAAGVVGSPVVVSPIVVITDLDSESLSSATVTVDDADDAVSFDSDLLPDGVTAEFVGGVLTFTGSASVVEYQQLLASVTLTAADAGVKTVSFAVVDAQGNSSALPAATVVTVVGVPGAVVAPVVVATPVAAGVVGSPVVVSPIVVITDLDSESLSSATVTVDNDDDALSYNVDLLPENVSAQLIGGVLTFTGVASKTQYQQLLASVTLSSETAGVKSVSFAVVDATGTPNALPASTMVSVVGLPAATVAPVVVATPVAGGTTGSAILVSPVVVITDLDSDMLSSATVAVDNAGDVLGYDAGLLPGSVSAGFSGGVLSFTGAASVADYQQLLASVTLTSDSPGVKTVSFAVADSSGVASTLPALTLVTVLGLPATQIAPVVVPAPAAAGTTGSPVVVSPVIVITDVDSTELSSATIALGADAAAGGDVLGFDAGLVPQNVAANFANGVLTFTGVASIAEYQQLLASVSITAASAGVKTVSFGVVDASGITSALPAATLVTVLGLPTTQVAPVVVAAVVAAGTAGSPVVVSPVVLIADVDSTELSSATVSLDPSDLDVGDVLGFDSGLVPEGVTVEFSGGVLTFTGSASLVSYQQLLASVTLTSNSAGVKTVGFAVVDGQGRPSPLPAETLVTLLGAPTTQVAPVVVASPVAAGVGGSAIVVSPVVVITDLDSNVLSSATVTVDDFDDVLGFDGDLLPATVSAGFVGGVLTFTGAASVAEYQQLLASVTLTSDTAGVKTVSFVVADELGNESILPAGTLVTVVGAPGAVVAPVVVATPVAAGTAGSPVLVSPIVVITDLDSESLSSATVTVDDADDVLGYDAGLLPGTVSAGFVGGVLSFTGSASVAEYQQLLASVTLTSNTAGVKTVSFVVTDESGSESILPAATLVTVVGVPSAEVAPVVMATPVAAGTTGSPVVVSPIVVVTDLDSESLSSATVSVDDAGDVLGYDAGLLPGTVSVGFVGGVLSFTGAASVAEYEQLLASVTLTSNAAGVKTVSFEVVDSLGAASALPAATLVTVVGVPGTEVAPVVVASPVSAGVGGSEIVVSPVVVITDLDSESLSSATVTVDDAGDVLGYDAGLLPGTVSAGFVGGVLSFTGAASVAEYEQLLASVTLTSNTAGVKTVSFVVADELGNESVLPAATLVTVVGAPSAEVAPVVVATPVAAGVGGSAIVVSPVVVITDLDSSELLSATVSLDQDAVAAGDSLNYAAELLPQSVEADFVDGVLTFTGLASVAEYQQLLSSVTISTTSAGVKTVSFAVTDSTGTASAIPAATLVTVLAAPTTDVSPVVVASVVNVGYAAGGTPIPIDANLIILDVDSAELKSATVTVGGYQAGDELTWGTLPQNVAANVVDGLLTFTGSASVAEYQQLLRSVNIATNVEALTAIRTISFRVVDAQDNQSVPAVVAVTVTALPEGAAPLVLASVVNVNYSAGGTPVPIDANLIILDLDSDSLQSATVTIGDFEPGDELTWGALPQDVGADFTDGVLTFTGEASLEDYQQLLRSVSIQTSSGALTAIRSISFRVTDTLGQQSLPGLVAVTVVAVPQSVPPLVVPTIPAVVYTAGEPALNIATLLNLVDVDSQNLSGATIALTGGNLDADETLSFTTQSGISGVYSAGTLTLSGTATVAQYQAAIRSVTFSTDSSADATIRTISIVVTDAQGSSSLPGSVAVTVLAAPINLAPLVTTSLLGPVYTAGNDPEVVDSLVTIIDLDSTLLQGATVQISDGLTDGDVLAFTSPSGSSISGTYVEATGTLTLSGTATVALYRQALRSVTFAADGSAPAATRTISFAVTDTQGGASAEATATVSVRENAAPLLTPSSLVGTYSNLLLGLQLIPVPLIVDTSSYLQSASVTITNPSSNDSLSVDTTGSALTAGYAGGVLSLTGQGTVAEYQSVLNTLRFRGTFGAVQTRDIDFEVTDMQGASSDPARLQVGILLL